MKTWILALLVSIVAGTSAMAQETNFSQGPNASFDQTLTPRRGPWRPGPGPGYPGGPGYGRGYYVQWRDVYTGQSISGWQPSPSPSCGSASNCACGGQNYCGTFGAGQQVYYWDQGCWNQPRTLVCDVQQAF